MQGQLQEKVEKIQGLQKTQQKTLAARQTLDSQLNENKLVKEELDKLEDDAKVFKLIGPALVKQETTEAKQNVEKRIEYISGELKRHDATLADLDKKQDELKEELGSLQAQMQKLAQAWINFQSLFLLKKGFHACKNTIFFSLLFPEGILDLYDRLFNHRPFLRGEITHFVKEFESKRGKEKDVENLFKTLELTTELQSSEVAKVEKSCEEHFPTVNANLLVAQSMFNKILDQANNSDLDRALESSRQAREKDWSNFMSDFQNKCEKIDDAYNQKEEALKTHYAKLEKDFK